jgi:hypothetical protein
MHLRERQERKPASFGSGVHHTFAIMRVTAAEFSSNKFAYASDNFGLMFQFMDVRQ